MIKFDDDFDKDEQEEATLAQKRKKKVLLIILPSIILIGLAVSFYAVITHKEPHKKNYNIVVKNDTNTGIEEKIIFYDLPEINAILKASNNTSNKTLKIQFSLEISDNSEKSIKQIEGLSPKIQDEIISHLVELYPEEINNSEGLYWLKEEILYRVNLITDPLKIKAINIKNIDIQQEQQG